MLISLSLNDHNPTIPHKKILPLKLCVSFLLRKARTYAPILARWGLESTVELAHSRTELAKILMVGRLPLLRTRAPL